jgi:hypothetical protein
LPANTAGWQPKASFAGKPAPTQIPPPSRLAIVPVGACLQANTRYGTASACFAGKPAPTQIPPPSRLAIVPVGACLQANTRYGTGQRVLRRQAGSYRGAFVRKL